MESQIGGTVMYLLSRLGLSLLAPASAPMRSLPICGGMGEDRCLEQRPRPVTSAQGFDTPPFILSLGIVYSLEDL